MTISSTTATTTTTTTDEDKLSRTKMAGWLLKGSDTSLYTSLASRRYGVLNRNSFKSYRKEEDEKPTAIWPLVPKCEVTRLEEKEIYVRPKGKNPIVAIVAGKYGKINGFTFSVIWPTNTKNAKLILGFEDMAIAARWQTAFLEVVELLCKNKSEEEQNLPSSPCDSPLPPLLKKDAIDSVKNMIQEEDKKSVFTGNNIKEEDSELNETMSSAPIPLIIDRDGIEIKSQVNVQDKQQTFENNGNVGSNKIQEGFWSPWKHSNGLCIYKEQDKQNGGESFMVSTIIRSSPSECFRALMESTKDKSMGISGFFNMELLEVLDENAQVTHSRIEPRCWGSSFLAPRDIVVQRNWRKEEEDGTYVILLHSVDKFLSNAKRENNYNELFFKCFKEPVRAQVMACGFTIAPLREKYCIEGSESSESLVTMVLKIDLNGIFSEDSLLSPIINFFGMKEAWIESILMTVVTLKDRVEHSKFVTVPFSVEHRTSPVYKHHNSFSSSSIKWNEDDKRVLKSLDSLDLNSKGSSSHYGIIGAEIENSSSNVKKQSHEYNSKYPEMLDPKYWDCPGSAGYKVRGENYLVDRKKIMASEPMYDLMSVDLVKLDKPTPHIARYLNSIQKSTALFSFVLQIMVPGPPDLALVITWGCKDNTCSHVSASKHSETENVNEIEQELSPFDHAFMRFLEGDDEVRNNVFKLIPHIVKGSFVIKQSVGSTPVLLGKKLKQHYFMTQKYIEVDVDVGSSYTAATVVSLVSSATKSIVVDLAVVMEGRNYDELPEALLGTVRLTKLDLGMAVYLDTSKILDDVENDNN